jgi:cell division cycle 20-like protein 1 (cofactor of APC complex)
MVRRQLTPVNSPQKEKYGDRFIPSRAGNNWQVNFNMIQDKGSPGKKSGREAGEGAKDYSLSIYSSLLKNEILGSSIEDFKEASEERRAMAPLPEGRNLFSYR